MSKFEFMYGNQAIAEGAIAVGCRFYAGYPITPSTEVAEILSDRLPEVGGAFVQMEDEIASMAAILGASLGGLKSATATSGPGFSLMQENLGYAVGSEIPCVVINVQRVGPSTGLPTKAAQGDIMQARWGTHGDHPIIALSPGSVQDCFDLTVKAFNFSEKYRTPVILLADALVSSLVEKIAIPDSDDLEVYDRPKPTASPKDYKAFAYTKGGVEPLANFGEGYRYHVTGLSHNEKGFPTEDSELVSEWWDHMHSKIDDNLDDILLCEEKELVDAEIAMIAYGGTAMAADHAVSIARQQGIKLGLLKLQTIWPFPEERVRKLFKDTGRIIVPELNFGQIRGEVERLNTGIATVEGINKADGNQITPSEILDVVKQQLATA